MVSQMYYREAVGAFVVYDVTQRSTFEMAAKWKKSLDKELSDEHYELPVVLLGNKCDLQHEPFGDIDAFCAEHKFVGHFETSAKENINIDEAVHALVTEILKTQHEPVVPHADIVDMSEPRQAKPQQGSCVCSS